MATRYEWDSALGAIDDAKAYRSNEPVMVNLHPSALPHPRGRDDVVLEKEGRLPPRHGALAEWTHHHIATDGSQVKNKVALGVVVVHTGPRPGTAGTAAAVGDTPKLDVGSEAVEVDPGFFRAVHAEGCIRPRYVGLHQQCNQDAEATAMADGLEVMDIARRGNLTTSFNVNAGDTLYWKFAVKNYDIDFKVKRGRGRR